VCLSTVWKPTFSDPHPRRNRVEIPDLHISTPGFNVLVDVTVAHSSSPSAGANVVVERGNDKAGKYDLSLSLSGADKLVAFAVESHGHIGTDASNLIESLARVGSDYVCTPADVLRSSFTDIIAIDVQRGHSSMMWAAKRSVMAGRSDVRARRGLSVSAIARSGVVV